jgi:predicted HTH transcriptional regulator
MRRMNICEAGGTGIDKVIAAVEGFQLPAPDYTAPVGSTRVFLYAPKKLTRMSLQERVRACYQHACLCFVSGQMMTNATLRKRFGIEEHNSARASRLIKEALDAKVIRMLDPAVRP